VPVQRDTMVHEGRSAWDWRQPGPLGHSDVGPYALAMPPWPPSGGAADDLTVAALAAFLAKSGGRRKASAVGFLYKGVAGDLYRNAIRARGGVNGFVNAHSDVFVLEPPVPGDKCPFIRLLTEFERAVASMADMVVERDVASNPIVEQTSPSTQAKKIVPPCRFHLRGRCAKGSRCAFSHDLPPPPQPLLSEGSAPLEAAVPAERLEALRSQVMYYLSDDNLRHDAFFQDIIASTAGGWIGLSAILVCPRMQRMNATAKEILDALDGEPGIELRKEGAGAGSLRRMVPPPPLAQRMIPLDGAAESSLSERPLETLQDRCTDFRTVVEDFPRRSFMLLRRSSWPVEKLKEELELLHTSIKWVALHNKKEASVTRSTAWLVGKGCCCHYMFGDASIEPQERPVGFNAIEERVLRDGCGLDQRDWPSSVCANLYENDVQNVGWHSDDETLFLGSERDCRIISASWGERRKFEVAVKDRHHVSGRPSIFRESLRSVMLHPGDICSMEGLFQKHYSHQLAKGPTSVQEAPPERIRINLTWRHIVQHKPYCPLSYQ